MAKKYEASSTTGHFIEQNVSSNETSVARLYNDKNVREQLGMLEQQISFLKQKNNLSVFNFAASHEREGVSSIVVNLAQLISGKNPERRVLLIDANLQFPKLHYAFNVASSPGLREALVDETGAFEYIHRFGLSGSIYVIPCGKNRVLHADALLQEKLLHLLVKLRGQYDYIFIDSPPILCSSNAITLAVSSDITFLVIEAFRTQREVVDRAKIMLEEKNCKIGGVILNRTRKVIPGWIYKKV